MVLSNTAVPIEYGKFRESVIRGEIPVNEEVSLQMNLIDAMIESPDYYYDDQAIEGFVRFCENECTLTDGSPVVLLDSFKLWAEDLLAWYKFVEEKVYDFKTKSYRYEIKKVRVRNLQYLIVGRGAAKSLYSSFMQQYFLNVDATTTHQVIVAPTMKQAEEIIQPIRTAITRSRGPLYKFLTAGNINSNTHTKTSLASTKKGIQNFITESLIEIRPMSIDKLQGLRTKMNSVDEWLSGRVKENVISTLQQGAQKIPDYTIVATSSEGTERDGEGDSIKMELQLILKGEYKMDNVSIWHYKLDSIEEIDDPDKWLKTNPNLGTTISYSAYENERKKMLISPSDRSDILAKIWGIPVEGLTFFFNYEDTIPHPYKNFDGMTCSMGVDLSQGDDFCAFTFLFPLPNGDYGVVTRSYVCETKIRKLPKAMVAKYEEFIEEGSLIVIEGSILNMEEVYDNLDEFIDSHDYDVATLGYDPWGAEYFINRWRVERGPYGIEIVRQGVKTESIPLGDISNLATDRRLIFYQNLMKFTMGNSIVIQDNNGNIKLDKRRQVEKIDNVAALMDAWVAYKRNKEVFE